MDRRYGSFPTTADVGIWARSSTAAGLFEALGLGLFALVTDLRRVRPREERTVQASAADPAALAVRFLEALLLLLDADDFLVRRLKVTLIGSPPTALLAIASGETFDPARHERRKQVKAVTYHGLSVDLTQGRARVIVDI